MTPITQSGPCELSAQNLDQISGGAKVPTNEAQIIETIRAKDFGDHNAFAPCSAFNNIA